MMMMMISISNHIGSGVFLQRACMASICPWLHFSALSGPLCANQPPRGGGPYLNAILWGSSLVLSPPSTLSTWVLLEKPFCQTPACSQRLAARRGRPTQKVLSEALQRKRSLSKEKGTRKGMDVIGRLRIFCRSTAPCCQTTSSAGSAS